MEDSSYSILRQFADSWGMLAMLLGFLGIVAWVVMGRRENYKDAADVVFRNEDKPKLDEASKRSAGVADHADGDDSGEEARS